MSTSELKMNIVGKRILFGFLVLVLGYLLVSVVVSNKLSAIEINIRSQITEQTAVLVAIAEATSRNGGDQVTESIAPDCPAVDRVQFDSLLNQLNAGLSHSQLIELDRLFGRCGGTFAKRKAVMATRLAREVEVYAGYVNQLGAIQGSDQTDAFLVTTWQELTEIEQAQSTYFSQLVTLQDRIITTLLNGKSATSPEIVEILQEVMDVKGELLLSNQRASEIRSALVPL